MTPGDDPRIGPFTLEVPPPSSNGSRVDHSSPADPLRQALPGFVVALVLALTAVPQIALLDAESFAQWWRLLIATALAGLAVGALVRRSALVAGSLGAAANVMCLFIAYGLVRDQRALTLPAGRSAADLGMLLAWSLASGGVSAVLGFVARSQIVRRRSSPVKPTYPRPN